VASTLADAFALLDNGPDWLILDLMLPDGDGERVLQTLRSSGSPTRVIVTTGVFDAQRLQEVSRLLPEAVLRKPIDVRQLLRMMA
jgi:DNA-binding NarL/FixJ family response regulator